MASFKGMHFRSALDAIEAIRDAQSTPGVCAVISALVGSFGYDHICFLASAGAKQSFDDKVLLKAWPKSWAEQYAESNFYAFDPVAPRIRQSPESFAWSDIQPSATEPIANEIMRIAATDYGLKHGLCTPVHGLNGYQAGVSLAGRDVDDTSEARAAIELVTMYAVNRLVVIRSRQPARRPILTQREREVMSWVAAGKTAWDTSAILKISEDTVNKTVSMAMHKLNVHTRAQAVAEAIRNGEIAL
ncbi:MAG: transcriptional regulator, LuxR family [Tardiphaga sp.]|uniref:helix-turn-helix transcriptional regulator n=1 Tax=Tardiphaga sp. TaxID=1926292 RepID=UPI0026214B1C|nr:LuxR family transcriptional regulator [Tardiphaga sp.]MDB5502574.1 transcriptional regulator, LuxR family [Tardiphaga sp.]